MFLTVFFLKQLRQKKKKKKKAHIRIYCWTNDYLGTFVILSQKRSQGPGEHIATEEIEVFQVSLFDSVSRIDECSIWTLNSFPLGVAFVWKDIRFIYVQKASFTFLFFNFLENTLNAFLQYPTPK